MESVERVAFALCQAERQIGLLDRVRPLELRELVERLVADWDSGNESTPAPRYAKVPDFVALRRGLDRIVKEGERAYELGEFGPWFRERASELGCEAALVASMGTAEFASRARERFADPSGTEGEQVERLVEEWLAEPWEPDSASRYPTDDRSCPDSLVSVLARRLCELHVKSDIRVVANLSSVAAVSADCVVIRAGEMLTKTQARRIAEHEIRGHLVPRTHGQHARGLLRAGTRDSSADEEGRALLIELRSGLMDSARKRELALRHRACVWSRQGADFVTVVRMLRHHATTRLSIGIALRCFRGSPMARLRGDAWGGRSFVTPGLAREIIYLPALIRVRKAFAEEPHLEPWLEKGRASVAFARWIATKPVLHGAL